MARYQDAIDWIALNDDTDFLDEEGGTLSVTAMFVADLFHKDDETVKADLRKALDQKELRKNKKAHHPHLGHHGVSR